MQKQQNIFYSGTMVSTEIMNRTATTAPASSLMQDFAAATGLDPASACPKRYLWTDAFAVCNYCGLYLVTGTTAYRELALRLVDQVHHTLGRHRGDDGRTGWISGLSLNEGEKHPTAGGLRIGKTLPERTAVELAHTAHTRFTYRSPSGGRKRMYWKMSIDLSRPLVPSMGQHDPLDGLVTCRELQLAAVRNPGLMQQPVLVQEIADMTEILRGMHLATDDPLGIGGLLSDAARVARMTGQGDPADAGLLETILDSALAGLDSFTGTGLLELPARYRLAFRELGLSTGLAGVETLPELDGKNRRAGTWTEHREINTVMLATSLAPGGFLGI
jgi:hypothetical protein